MKSENADLPTQLFFPKQNNVNECIYANYE